MSPAYLSDTFMYVDEYQPYRTRTADTLNLVLPRTNTSLCQNSFFFTGVKMWNSLPIHVKQGSNLHMFKNLLKYHVNNV